MNKKYFYIECQRINTRNIIWSTATLKDAKGASESFSLRFYQYDKSRLELNGEV